MFVFFGNEIRGNGSPDIWTGVSTISFDKINALYTDRYSLDDFTYADFRRDDEDSAATF
jgi:hypothetical protein